jgi:hypothetical protein
MGQSRTEEWLKNHSGQKLDHRGAGGDSGKMFSPEVRDGIPPLLTMFDGQIAAAQGAPSTTHPNYSG